jgi:hypothetical protein
MDLPRADGADPAAVFAAALTVLFTTRPNPAALLTRWEPIAAHRPIMMMKSGAQEAQHNANVVIAQALLHIACEAAGESPPAK